MQHFDLSLDYYADGGASDRGCKYSPSCRQCRFRSCIDGLRHAEKVLILQAQTIQSVYSCHDMGMNSTEIHKAFNSVPLPQIKQWIKNRAKIMPKLEKYQLVGIR